MNHFCDHLACSGAARPPPPRVLAAMGVDTGSRHGLHAVDDRRSFGGLPVSGARRTVLVVLCVLLGAAYAVVACIRLQMRSEDEFRRGPRARYWDRLVETLRGTGRAKPKRRKAF